MYEPEPEPEIPFVLPPPLMTTAGPVSRRQLLTSGLMGRGTTHCPKCGGFAFRERMGFLWLTWVRCFICGWHGDWAGRDPDALPPELAKMVEEVEAVGRARRTLRAARQAERKTSRFTFR